MRVTVVSVFVVGSDDEDVGHGRMVRYLLAVDFGSVGVRAHERFPNNRVELDYINVTGFRNRFM